MCETNAIDKQATREITPAELPLYCPTADMGLWNSHPRVFLPIEAGGKARCPYCGTAFVLRESD